MAAKLGKGFHPRVRGFSQRRKENKAPRHSFAALRNFELLRETLSLIRSITFADMQIKSAEYVISSPDLTMCPPADKPEFAFIGRSNVGKSSLINMLADNHKLAKTSGTPGKTQLINHFIINKQWYLVDLPGYGFAKVSQNSRNRWEQMIENYLRKRENLANVFVLIDGRHQPQKIDLEFVNQLGKWEVPFCLVFTKSDKETQKVVSMNVKTFLDRMRETWQFLPRHFVTSAIKKLGREKILEFIEGEMKQPK